MSQLMMGVTNAIVEYTGGSHNLNASAKAQQNELMAIDPSAISAEEVG